MWCLLVGERWATALSLTGIRWCCWWGAVVWRTALMTGRPLIDALAREHRAVAMDYEGIGRTTSRSGNLTIPRLANDTAAFMAALH